MAKLITFVGVSGVGKTTLARALAATGNFATGFEQHDTRPFQHLFDMDKRYALHNQIDYFLLRAEQERTLRADPRLALVDGGLDVDFHGFARLFNKRGYLSDAEFDLCERLYTQLRLSLPLPEIIIYLTASKDIIQERLANRDRVNIATSADAEILDAYLKEWLNTLPPAQILHFDLSEEKADYKTLSAEIMHLLF